jgi:hypothetical protein
MIRTYLEKLNELAIEKKTSHLHFSHTTSEESRVPYHNDMACLMGFASQRIAQMLESLEGRE